MTRCLRITLLLLLVLATNSYAALWQLSTKLATVGGKFTINGVDQTTVGNTVVKGYNTTTDSLTSLEWINLCDKCRPSCITFIEIKLN